MKLPRGLRSTFSLSEGLLVVMLVLDPQGALCAQHHGAVLQDLYNGPGSVGARESVCESKGESE